MAWSPESCRHACHQHWAICCHIAAASYQTAKATQPEILISIWTTADSWSTILTMFLRCICPLCGYALKIPSKLPSCCSVPTRSCACQWPPKKQSRERRGLDTRAVEVSRWCSWSSGDGRLPAFSVSVRSSIGSRSSTECQASSLQIAHGTILST